jgi:hypothetical protein
MVRTRKKVPMSSATYFFMTCLLRLSREGEKVAPRGRDD